jgi:hypothetical protein
MIKDRAYWEAWELQGPLRERLDLERAFELCDAMYEYAKSLGVFPPADPLEGIETKIRMARVINLLPPLSEATIRGIIMAARPKSKPAP